MEPPKLVDGQIPMGRWVCTVDEAETEYVTGRAGDREAIWSEWQRLTRAVKQAVGEVAACWLSGSLFTDKPDPADIDCVYVIDTDQLHVAAAADPRVAAFLVRVASGRVKHVYGMRVDSFILEWIPTSGPARTPGAEQYFEDRGYWDDLWSRVKDADLRLDSIPRRGYLEVIIDGYK